MAVYGFIGSDHRIAPDYNDLDMVSYRVRHDTCSFVTENTTTHVIEIRDTGVTIRPFQSKRKSSHSNNQIQLEVMKKLADHLNPHDILMFRTVQDLSEDKDYAAVIYKAFIEKDIQLEFLYDPACDFSIYRKTYIDNPSVVEGILPQILSASLTVPVSRKTFNIPKSGKKRQKSCR